MTLVWKPGYSFDSDASTYIDAVETADGQALETGVRVAINDFVLGCKQDEIWDAIKASCILAGARTLDGALVPLVGTAPTNNNFASGDYDRETGIACGSTKYLDSNRADNEDGIDNHHLSVYCGTAYPTATQGLAGAFTTTTVSATRLYRSSSSLYSQSRRNGGAFVVASVSGQPLGLYGISRSSSLGHTTRVYGADYISNFASASNTTLNIYISGINNNGTAAPHNGSDKIAFYSIGESLDLAALDTRVSNLITAIGAAIP